MKKNNMLALALALALPLVPVSLKAEGEYDNDAYEKEVEDAYNKLIEENSNAQPKKEAEEAGKSDSNSDGNGYENLGKNDPKPNKNDDNPDQKTEEEAKTEKDKKTEKDNTEGTQTWLKVAQKKLEQFKTLRAELVQQLKDIKNDPWSTAGAENKIKELDKVIKELEYAIEKELYFHWTKEDVNKLEDVYDNLKKDVASDNKGEAKKDEAKKDEAKKDEAKKDEAKKDSNKGLAKTSIAGTSIAVTALSMAAAALAYKKRK